MEYMQFDLSHSSLNSHAGNDRQAIQNQSSNAAKTPMGNTGNTPRVPTGELRRYIGA